MLCFLQGLVKEEYQRRYNQLVQRVGLSGLGVETLLQHWEADYPDDTDMLEAKFGCFFQKSASPKVIQLSQDRYLGREPLIPYTDSTGVKQNYFEDTEYGNLQGIQYTIPVLRLVNYKNNRIVSQAITDMNGNFTMNIKNPNNRNNALYNSKTNLLPQQTI